MWRMSAVGLAVGCVTALLAGCTAAVPTGPGSAPAGVRIEVLQGRTDYTSGTLVIRLINGSTDDVEVSRARLDAPGFGSPAVWERGTTVRPGTTVDLRAPVPDPDCDEAPGAPQVELTTGTGDSRSTATVTAKDPLGTLERLHTTGCITARVDRIAQLRVGLPVVERTGSASVAVLSVSFTPTGADGSVSVAGIGATPLLKPAEGVGTDADGWPVEVTVDAASEPVTIPLRIVPARCDPHAVAEDKIGTVLVVSVTLDDGTTGNYRLTPPGDIREALLDFVREHCGMA